MRSLAEGIVSWLLWIQARALQGRQGELSGYTASTCLEREYPTPFPSLKHPHASNNPWKHMLSYSSIPVSCCGNASDMQSCMNMVWSPLFKEHYHLIRASPPHRYMISEYGGPLSSTLWMERRWCPQFMSFCAPAAWLFLA